MRAPDLPVRETVRSALPGLVLGYGLAEQDFAQCPNLADLLELRLLPLQFALGAGSTVEATCVRLRQSPFLMIVAVEMVDPSRPFEEEPIRKAIETMSITPATAEERKLVASRQRERRRALDREPRAVAELLAELLTVDGLKPAEAMNRFVDPAESSSSGVTELARRLFVNDRSVTLQLKR